MFKKTKFLSLLLVITVAFTLVVGCSDDGGSNSASGEDDDNVPNKPNSIIVSYPNGNKIIAYSLVDGSSIKEVDTPGSDGAGSALAVYGDKIYYSCGNNSSKLYIFDNQLNKLDEKVIATWAPTTFDNPNSMLIVDATHGYMSLMGQSDSTDGCIIEFNPTDYTFTSKTDINESADNDNPNALYYYNGKVYCTVYTMDAGFANKGSYIYNVTDVGKIKDLTAVNVQSSAGHLTYLYCTGTDKLEVVDLSDSSSTVVNNSGTGNVLITGTVGIMAGGYDAGWTLINKMWSFDPAAGTGVLTEIIDGWGGAAVLCTDSYYTSMIYAMTNGASKEVRETPFGAGNVVVESANTHPTDNFPGAIRLIYLQ